MKNVVCLIALSIVVGNCFIQIKFINWCKIENDNWLCVMQMIFVCSYRWIDFCNDCIQNYFVFEYFSIDRLTENAFLIRINRFKSTYFYFSFFAKTILWHLIKFRFDVHIKYWMSLFSIYFKNTHDFFLFMNLFFQIFVKNFEFTNA